VCVCARARARMCGWVYSCVSVCVRACVLACALVRLQVGACACVSIAPALNSRPCSLAATAAAAAAAAVPVPPPQVASTNAHRHGNSLVLELVRMLLDAHVVIAQARQVPREHLIVDPIHLRDRSCSCEQAAMRGRTATGAASPGGATERVRPGPRARRTRRAGAPGPPACSCRVPCAPAVPPPASRPARPPPPSARPPETRGMNEGPPVWLFVGIKSFFFY